MSNFFGEAKSILEAKYMALMVDQRLYYPFFPFLSQFSISSIFLSRHPRPAPPPPISSICACTLTPTSAALTTVMVARTSKRWWHPRLGTTVALYPWLSPFFARVMAALVRGKYDIHTLGSTCARWSYRKLASSLSILYDKRNAP